MTGGRARLPNRPTTATDQKTLKCIRYGSARFRMHYATAAAVHQVDRIWVPTLLLHQKFPFNEPLRNQTKPQSQGVGLGDRLRLLNICAEMAGRHDNVNNIETQFTINNPQSEQIKTGFWGVNLPESPPDVEAHCVQPEERSQEEEVHGDCCNEKKFKVNYSLI